MRNAILLLTVLMASPLTQAGTAPVWYPETETQLEPALVARWGEAQRPRVQRGLRQVASLWRETDGDATTFAAFATENFAGDQPTLEALFTRFQRRLEVLDGHMVEIGYEFRLHRDLDRGPLLPFDATFAAYAPAAHVTDDFFANKLAFVALLNFPVTTLEQRLTAGAHWPRRQWAETRLAERFGRRIPAEVNQGIAAAQGAAELYITDYKIWAHHLVDAAGGRAFAPGLQLISHWNLRDEIKAQYANSTTGIAAQRTLQRVMERIIDQSIPQIVVNNPAVDWNPFTNAVAPAAVRDAETPALAGGAVDGAPEPDTRYARWLADFQANRRADPFAPNEPTHILRRFEGDRQMPEARVQAMLEQVLGSPQFAQVGRLIAQRLGRPLEPFDLWYNGFRPRGQYTEAQLDEITRKRFPTAEAYRADMPHILQQLGFTAERAGYLRDHIDVEASRGIGHALGGAMRGQKARLRTRVEAGGMNYKGFNIALHEMGHNLEETFSLYEVDYTLLAGVPNTAFTEALAMVVQGHDFEVLGLAATGPETVAAKTLDDFWQAAEISGVALLDMAVWHWMYAHPAATPAELKAATVALARDLWNRWYAPVFGQRDATLLAIYSHLIYTELYLPDYPIGHLIGFQIEEQMRKAGNFGAEFERMTKFGNLPPDLWMQNATGAPVGAEALLRAAAAALRDAAFEAESGRASASPPR